MMGRRWRSPLVRSEHRSVCAAHHRRVAGEAYRHGSEVGYLDLFAADIVGDCATLDVAAGFKEPTGASNDHAYCASDFMYEKVEGRWRYKYRLGDMCE